MSHIRLIQECLIDRIFDLFLSTSIDDILNINCHIFNQSFLTGYITVTKKIIPLPVNYKKK